MCGGLDGIIVAAGIVFEYLAVAIRTHLHLSRVVQLIVLQAALQLSLAVLLKLLAEVFGRLQVGIRLSCKPINTMN
jgi:hypothetical protein